MFIRCFIKILTLWGKLCLPLFLCTQAIAAAKLPVEAEWLNLLHFKGKQTLLDSSTFFLSPDGYKNPKAELEASLTAVNSDQRFGKLKLPFACAYPARFKYLSQKFNLPPIADCQELDEWLKGLNAESLSLVFASYYPNNPASIFGHTFLKINTSDENKISDYALNYLAITSESNGLIFGLKGLAGMYRGQFSIMPYFLKVNEYNHSESRDLFEYHLRFTEDEIDTLLRHVWELENNGYFNYYFLDDNCSYFLMRILDIARPSLNLSRKFPYAVVPAETIKAVYQSGLTEKIEYRPSLYTRLNQRIQEKGFKDLDTQILLGQFKKQAQKKWNSEDEKKYYKLLTARSKQADSGKDSELKPGSYPHETHSPHVLTLGTGIIQEKAFTRLSLRPGVHQLLEPTAGYLPFSSVELFQTTFRTFKTSQIYLEQFTLIDVVTLNPHKAWNSKLSWKSKIEFKKFDQDLCSACEVKRFSTGIGKSFELNSSQLLSFFMNGQLLFSDQISKRLSIGILPELTYHYSSRSFNTESSLSLITRSDQAQISDSFKISQGLGIHLQRNYGLRLKVQYYAPISDKATSRSEGLLEWVIFY